MQPLTFFEALAAMRAGSRVFCASDRVEYRISGGKLERRYLGGDWGFASRLTVNEALIIQWFRIEVEQ